MCKAEVIAVIMVPKIAIQIKEVSANPPRKEKNLFAFLLAFCSAIDCPFKAHASLMVFHKSLYPFPKK